MSQLEGLEDPFESPIVISNLQFQENSSGVLDAGSAIDGVVDVITPPADGRFRRIGRFLLDLPSKAHDRLQYAAVTFQNNPVHFAKRTVQGGIIAAELSLANEAIRYGALTYALTNTRGGAAIGAVVLGLTTFAVEASAAIATADIITTKNSSRAINWINEKIEKIVPKNFKMNPVAEAGVAMLGGSVVVLAEKQREDPTRTVEQNRKHGLFTAGWMSGYFALEGAWLAENTENQSVLNAKTIGAFILALGVSWAGAKVAFKRGENNEDNLE